MDVRSLAELTPLVAVCVIFAALLTSLMVAFLKHLNVKDERTADLVESSQRVLSGIQTELTRLADNDRQQTELLQQLLLQAYRQFPHKDHKDGEQNHATS